MDTLYVNTDIFLVVKYVLLSKKKKKKKTLQATITHCNRIK